MQAQASFEPCTYSLGQQSMDWRQTGSQVLHSSRQMPLLLSFVSHMPLRWADLLKIADGYQTHKARPCM